MEHERIRLRASVRPDLLRWARERAALTIGDLEGQTLFREAYQILGIRKHETFQKFAETLGVR